MSSNPSESRRIIETSVRATHATFSARPMSDARVAATLAAIIPAMDAKPLEWFDGLWDAHNGNAGREAWIALAKEVSP